MQCNSRNMLMDGWFLHRDNLAHVLNNDFLRPPALMPLVQIQDGYLQQRG